MAPHQRMIGEKYDYAITVGVFDLTHFAHEELFDFMKARARYLCVIVHDDFSTYLNKRKFPAQRLDHRMDNVRHFVDWVEFVKTADPSDKIEQVVGDIRGENPDARICFIRGDDMLSPPGRQTIVDLGLDIVFKPYTEGVSSSRRRKEIEA